MIEPEDPWEVGSKDEFLLSVDLGARSQSPPGPSAPLEFEAQRPSRWLVTPPLLAEAGEELRRRIGDRDLEAAIAASSALSRAAQEVAGVTRSRSPYDPLPPVDRLEKLVALRRDSMLSLDLGEDPWDELIDGVLWMWLATDRFDIHGVAATAFAVAATGDVPWPAFRAERDRPGSAPALRQAQDLWSDGYWQAAEKRGWPDPAGSVLVRVRNLSNDARFLLGAANRVSGREVVEARMLGHTVKWPAWRLRIALAELEKAGFALDPPGIEDVAMMLTAASLRALASEAGLRATGAKLLLCRRLIEAGRERQILQAAAGHSGFNLLALGVTDPALAAMKSIGRLWVIAMGEAVGMGTDFADDDDEDAHLWAVSGERPAPRQDPTPTDRPSARWALQFPAAIQAVACDDRFVFVHSNDGQIVAIEGSGVVVWRSPLGPAAGWVQQLLLVDDGPVVAISNDAVAGFDRLSGERSWVWTPSPGETLAQQPASDGSRLYVTSSAGLHAIDGLSGQIRWEFLRRRVQSPSISAGRITAPIAGGPVHVLDRETGEPVARVRREGLPNDYHPRLIGSTVVLSGRVPQTEQFDAIAIDISTGAERWRAGRYVERADRLADHVLISGHDLRLVEPETGRTVWRSASDARAMVDPSGALFLLGDRGLAKADAETGRRTAAYSRWDRLNQVCAWGDDVVVVDQDVVGLIAGPRPETARGSAETTDGTFRGGQRASVAWSAGLDQSLDALAMGPDTVVAVTIDGATAWDSRNGQVRWFQDVWYQHLLIVGGVAVLSGNQQGAIGLDLRDGSMRWVADLGDYAGRFEDAGDGRIVAELEGGGSVWLDSSSGLDVAASDGLGATPDEGEGGPGFTIEEHPPQVTWQPDGATTGWSVALPAGWEPDQWCATWANQVAFSFRRNGWHLGESGSLVLMVRTAD